MSTGRGPKETSSAPGAEPTGWGWGAVGTEGTEGTRGPEFGSFALNPQDWVGVGRWGGRTGVGVGLWRVPAHGSGE